MSDSIQGATPSASGSQASLEAASHLRPTGVDPSRMQWQPIATAPSDVRGLVYFNCRDGRGVSLGKAFRFGDEVTGIAEGFHGDWNVTHWMPLPPAPGMEAEGQVPQGLGSKTDSPIAESEAPVNSLMLSALKAMDAALTEAWTAPDHAKGFEYDGTVAAWIQIRSAIARADGGGKDERA